MAVLLHSVPVRWLIAIIGFPIGGFIGHLVAGPAATVPAAALSGGIAGAVIGLGQGLALDLRSRTLLAWTAATAIGLGLSLAAVTLVTGQIATMAEAVAFGAIAGLMLGAGQAAVLQRLGVRSGWMWAAAGAVAWAAGWFVTTTVGVALSSGWPVYGLSGALVSQAITAVAIWRLMALAPRPFRAATPA
jgi:hypothetical protein